MITLFISWGVLALAVITLAAMRKIAARDENDVLHVDDPSFVNRQQSVARRLDKIDNLGKPLTIVLVVYGIGLLAWYLYTGWQQSQGLN